MSQRHGQEKEVSKRLKAKHKVKTRRGVSALESSAGGNSPEPGSGRPALFLLGLKQDSRDGTFVSPLSGFQCTVAAAVEPCPAGIPLP